MLLVNDTDATIAQKHTIYPTWIMPGSIIRMIPLCGLPDRGPSLPPEESPATPIWAKIVNTIVEVGRTLWNLFVAGVSFIAELLEKVAEWGLDLLGRIMNYIEQVAKMFSFVLKIIAEIVGYFFRMLVSAARMTIGRIVDIIDIEGGFKLSFGLSILTIDVSFCVKYIFVDFLGFDIPHLVVSFSLNTQSERRKMQHVFGDDNNFGIAFIVKISALFYAELSSTIVGEFQEGGLSDEEKEIAEETVASLDIKHMLLTFGEVCLAETLHHITIPPMSIVSETHPEYGVPGFLVSWGSLWGVCLSKLFWVKEHKCSEYLGVLLGSLLFLFVDLYLLLSMRSVSGAKEFKESCENVVGKLVEESVKREKLFGVMLHKYKWSTLFAIAFGTFSFALAVAISIAHGQEATTLSIMSLGFHIAMILVTYFVDHWPIVKAIKDRFSISFIEAQNVYSRIYAGAVWGYIWVFTEATTLLNGVIIFVSLCQLIGELC